LQSSDDFLHLRRSQLDRIRDCLIQSHYSLEQVLFRTVGNGSQTAHLAIRFSYGNGYRLGMDIQAQKSYLLLHDRFLSACGSVLCSCSVHSLTA
jgi:hypothetical protein